jgi:hypothetical protein
MSDGSATIAKWTRKQEKAEDNDKKAHQSMKQAIIDAMKDPQTHLNLIKERQRAKDGGGSIAPRSCWGDDGEEFTGIYEERPWERD